MLFPVSTPKDIYANPQLAHREFFAPVAHPELETSLPYPGPWFRSQDLTPRIRRRAPLIGEHNLEILVGELGLSREDLWTLREVDAI
jgi:crotonobetainyl-CoA:carnitine CoA-transferase CaiB-like acyl-CoA transferase